MTTPKEACINSIDDVAQILLEHPTLNINALRAWSDATKKPVRLRTLRSGHYGSYSAIIPRLRYLKENGFITQQNGAITATSKRFTK